MGVSPEAGFYSRSNLIRDEICLAQPTSILTSSNENGGLAYLRNRPAIVRKPDDTERLVFTAQTGVGKFQAQTLGIPTVCFAKTLHRI